MSTKTIKIDEEALSRLEAVKRGGESYSAVIKRVVKEPVNFEAWARKVRRNRLKPTTIRAIESHIKDRRGRSRPGD